MESNPFQKAVKHEAKLRLAIAGPSGSGKTYTGLALATNLASGGRVALADTEHGSASKYADLFDFDVLDLKAPFHPNKFAQAIQDASGAGYSVLVLDSLSHAWNGPGGLLEIVDRAAKKYKGNTYVAWSEGTPIQNRMIEAIMSADIHIIATMRSKQDYILVEDKGKQRPQKVGMAPVQRDGFEYEFDVFLDMDVDNNAIVSKTRCTALTGAIIEKPGADLAQTLTEWLRGAPVVNSNGQTDDGRAESSPAEQGKRDEFRPTAETNTENSNGKKVMTAAKFQEWLALEHKFKNVHHVRETMKNLDFWPTPAKPEDRKLCSSVLAQYRNLRDNEGKSKDDATSELKEAIAEMKEAENG